MDIFQPGELQNLGGECGFLIGNRQRAEREPTEADLVPIIVALLPANFARDFRLSELAEPFLRDRLFDFRSRPGVEFVVKPVVAKGERGGHLRGVEEMARVPIREISHREHLLLRALEERPIAGDPEVEAP